MYGGGRWCVGKGEWCRGVASTGLRGLEPPLKFLPPKILPTYLSSQPHKLAWIAWAHCLLVYEYIYIDRFVIQLI